MAKLANAQDLKSCGCITLEGAIPSLGTTTKFMGMIFTKHINQDFFKGWSSEMSYVLGYITADGCIVVNKDRKSHPLTLNITSAEKKHLYRLRKALESKHKISRKSTGKPNVFAYQLQIRNPIITNDLMKLGIFPRKTSRLNPIKVPGEYFPDFVRGFFDGDGSVYVYEVNKTPQVKASFVSTSFTFFVDFNRRLCKTLNIPSKTIHQENPQEGKLIRYSTCFYVDDCGKLAEFIYGNKSILYLPRKRRIFEKWKLIKRRNYTKQNYPSKIGWRLNQEVFA